jgi:hypothetical protein
MSLPPIKKPKLAFLVEFPFSDRDLARFGIETLSSAFDVAVFDISNALHSRSPGIRTLERTLDSRLLTFETLEDAIFEIERWAPSFCISNLAPSSARHKIFGILRNNAVFIIKFRLGLTPGDSISSAPFLKRLTNRLKQVSGPTELGQLILRQVFPQKISPEVVDLVVTGGSRARTEMEKIGQNILMAHSLDFDSYRRQRQSPKYTDLPERFALYIDQDMGFHVDYKFSGLRVPIEAKQFYDDLNDYFRRFTKSTGLPIVVCPHPKSNPSLIRDRLHGVQITLEPTVRVTSQATCVLAHNSTALSFAVAWNKPAVLLADRRLLKSWEGPFVTALAEALGSRIDRIDQNRDSEPLPIGAPSCGHYSKYLSEYLSEVAEDPRGTWEIVRDALVAYSKMSPRQLSLLRNQATRGTSRSVSSTT